MQPERNSVDDGPSAIRLHEAIGSEVGTRLSSGADVLPDERFGERRVLARVD
jgi:hypothetical protein